MAFGMFQGRSLNITLVRRLFPRIQDWIETVFYLIVYNHTSLFVTVAYFYVPVMEG